jgi:hypothetical protein
MAITRKELLKELMPGINKLFSEVYSNYKTYRIEMPKRGRYQVWLGHEMVADRIKHRNEALALIKLLTSVNKTGGSDDSE